MLQFLCKRGLIHHRWGERLENDEGEGYMLCRRCGARRSGRPVDPPDDAPHFFNDR
jgi:hypothetical protein